MAVEENILQCPCPDTRKLSKEEKINAMVEMQCLQHGALLKQFDSIFKGEYYDWLKKHIH